MMIDEYSLLKCIGRGAFGEVYLTSKNGTTQLFATKKVTKQKIESPSVKKYFINEITILKELHHKNIVRLETIRQTIHNFYIITDYYNGEDLASCLRKHRMIKGKPFSEEIVQYLMKQVIDALKYLHSKRIIHRDLKLDNLLINFESEEDKKNLNMLKSEVKIIDFGFATYLDNTGLRYSILGSPINMDPTLLCKLINQNVSNLIGYDEKADIWSLGTVCYELITGKPIFHAQNLLDLVRLVENGVYHLPTDLSQEIVSFLTSMLQYSSKNRLNAEELSKHPFLTKNVSEFTKLDLTNYVNKIDIKGIIFNIKKDPQLDKPIFDVQARLNYYQQQQYYQNLKHNGIQRYTPAFNYYANTGPKYYMATTSRTNNRIKMNQYGQKQELLNPLISQKNNRLQRQPNTYQEKYNNNISVEQKYKNTKFMENQNFNTTKSSNNNYLLNNGRLPEKNIPVSPNNLLKNPHRLHETKSFEEKKYNNHINKHYSNKLYNQYNENPTGIPPIKEDMNPTPIPFSSPFTINNPMYNGPMPLSELENNKSDLNPFFSDNHKKNDWNNKNKFPPGYMGNHFTNIESKKEITSEALDDLCDFNIGKELEPEPDIKIDDTV